MSLKEILSEKSENLLVIYPGNSIRMKLRQTLNGLGFKNIETCDKVTEARRILSATKVDWVLTSLFPDTKENAIALLKFISSLQTTHTSLQGEEPHKIFVTVFINEDENSALSLAFENGLLSYLQTNFENETVSTGIVKLLEAATTYNFDPSLVAASYYRSYLQEKSKYKTLLNLEEEMVRVFPKNINLLLNYAEAQYLNKQANAANQALEKATQLDPNLATKIAALKSQYAANPEFAPAMASYQIKTAVVVDPDDASLSSMRTALTGFGVNTVQCFENGDEAYDWIQQNQDIDVLLTEWRVPKLTGPFLIQRVRMLGHGQMPIAIVSSLIKEADQPLLEELSVSKVLEKPASQAKIQELLEACTKQENALADRQVLERRLRAAYAKEDFVEADAIRQHLQASKRPSDQLLLRYAEAMEAYERERYAEAKTMAIAILKERRGEVLPVINLLGKCHLQLGEHKAALDLFRRAQVISPQNIERLCQIATANLQLGNLAESQDAVEKAEKLDADNQEVRNVHFQLDAVQTGLLSPSELIHCGGNADTLISYLNSNAIAKSRAGLHEESIKLYEHLISLLPKEDSKNLVRVSYNMGLTYVRSKQLSLAEVALRVAAEGHPDIAKKARSLLRRIEDSKQSGSDFILLQESAVSFSFKAPSLNDLEPGMSTVDYGEAETLDLGDFTETIGGSAEAEKILHCLNGLKISRDEFESLSLTLDQL